MFLKFDHRGIRFNFKINNTRFAVLRVCPRGKTNSALTLSMSLNLLEEGLNEEGAPHLYLYFIGACARRSVLIPF